MMNTTFKNKLHSLLLPSLLFTLLFTSCSSDDADVILPVPTISEVEIGLGNNEIGVVGRDFHFNAEILAGDKIDLVTIQFRQRSEETYSEAWSYEIIWDDYKGVKNATVHKHFDIPMDAIEGNYDLVITISDENGTLLEEVRNVTIYLPEHLPVDPQLLEFTVAARSDSYRVLYIHSLGGYRDPETLEYGNYNVYIDKGETLDASVNLGGLKDDGVVYMLLINKKNQHKPESISSIDFSKVVVIDVFEHTALEQTERWSNIHYERPNFPDISRLLVGASVDNNMPTPSPISDLKAWESGTYYVGFIYKNTTHNIELFQYMELSLNF
ncbi:DUF4625 domain-containing protein [Formosa sediminum]|uniref:DUF4625 domain-containing protein n=1 Tax=Formosa sediminum TaxID=2594004 RepID=A0A516GSE5_9FLAO|nr:DUF4625 domain-containing protein [Formosa sediminum]QDO94447.1 DUF4625 domain-containing protein [Formosa sediminum]